MQHDLHVNPSGRTRKDFPLLAVMQADVVEGNGRLVAPLGLNVAPLAGPPSRALPLVRHEGREYLHALPLLGTISRSRLKRPVGSIREHRDDITRALDWLFFGF